MTEEYTFYSPPEPNMKFRLGKDSTITFHSYSPKPPNAVQRWLLKTLLGIYMELI
jgi:hypothetical protein